MHNGRTEASANDAVRPKSFQKSESLCAFALSSEDSVASRVAFPPGRAKVSASPAPTGIVCDCERIGMVFVATCGKSARAVHFAVWHLSRPIYPTAAGFKNTRIL